MAVRSGDDRQVCHRLLQRLALARRAIIRIYFPPIPWPMTVTCGLCVLQVSCPFSLAGKVADMSATCRPDNQKSAGRQAPDKPTQIRSRHIFLCRGLPTFSKFSPRTRVRMYAQPAKNLYIRRRSILSTIHDRAVVDNNNTQQPT